MFGVGNWREQWTKKTTSDPKVIGFRNLIRACFSTRSLASKSLELSYAMTWSLGHCVLLHYRPLAHQRVHRLLNSLVFPSFGHDPRKTERLQIRHNPSLGIVIR